MVDSNIFDRGLDRLSRNGISPNDVDKSRKWFLKNAKALVGKYDNNKIMSEMQGKFRNITQIGVGQLVFFTYDAKYKEKLPFWDRFPCVLILSIEGDYFTGLNFHYLNPIVRTKFMQKLLANYGSSKELDERTRIEVSYGILKSTATLKQFQPCFKKYLVKHLRSKFVKIDGEEIFLAISLPVEQFEKAGKQQVWQNSKTKY